MKSFTLTSPPEPSSTTLGNWLIGNGTRLAVLMILVATYVAFARTPSFNFVYDDFQIILYNPRVHSAHFLGSYFTRQVWEQARSGAGNLYRPLFMTWLLANYKMFGLSPVGWHYTTVLVHLSATLLVYLLADKLIPENPIPALVSMAIFGLHPIHVESVAWISGVTDPLASCFFLGSFLSFILFQEKTGRPFKWLTASLLLYAAALCSKETTVVLPAVIAWYRFCFVRGNDRALSAAWIRSTATLLTPYFVLMLLYVGIRSIVLHGFAHTISGVPLGTAVLAMPWAIYFYLSQILIPAGLGPFYDIEYANMLSIMGLVLPSAVLIVLLVLVIWWTRKSKLYLILFLAGWFLLTLLPSLGVLIMSRYEGVHDRYLYLPSVAIAVLAGYAWGRVFSGTRRSLQISVAASLFSLLIFSTWRQTEYWKNDLALFTRACAVAPHNPLAKLNLAAELARQNQYVAGLKEAQDVIQQDPTLSVAFSLAGKCSYFLGDYAAAEAYYKPLLASGTSEAGDVYLLGLTEIKLGRYEQALQVLRAGLSLWPSSPLYHYAMGLAFAGMGEWSAALEEYKLEAAQHPESFVVGPARAEVEAHLKTGGDAAK
jgi:protein O-mannosyl-transferase